jgi:hypothetical protein
MLIFLRTLPKEVDDIIHVYGLENRLMISLDLVITPPPYWTHSRYRFYNSIGSEYDSR